MRRSLRTMFTALAIAACPCTCGTSSASPAPRPPAFRITTAHQASFTVKAMSCHGCAVHVEKTIRKQDGVSEVRVDRDKQQVVVTFDPAKLTSETIRRTIEAAGYPATLIEEHATDGDRSRNP